MRPFVVIQVAFSLIVLFVGGLLVRSFVKLSSVNPGFATSDVLLVSWEAVQRMEPNQQRAALLQVLDRLRDLPGVAAVSAAEFNVLGRPWRNDVPVPGTARETIEATMAPVTPGYFETMKIPLLAGRTFVRGDLDTESPTAVIVNESFAKRYFGGEPAVGRLFDAQLRQDARRRTRSSASWRMFVTTCASRRRRRSTSCSRCESFGTLHVRVAGDATTIAARLRDEVRAATPLLRVTSVTSQAAMVNRTLVRERLLALLSGFFALVGLVLTAVGLYGTLSYAVVQRTREIGIRVALGARALGAVRSVLADTAGATLIGAACGLAGGLYASRFVETMLFEVAALRCLESCAAARHAAAGGVGGGRRSRLARGTRRSGHRATQRVAAWNGPGRERAVERPADIHGGGSRRRRGLHKCRRAFSGGFGTVPRASFATARSPRHARSPRARPGDRGQLGGFDEIAERVPLEVCNGRGVDVVPEHDDTATRYWRIADESSVDRRSERGADNRAGHRSTPQVMNERRDWPCRSSAICPFVSSCAVSGSAWPESPTNTY